MFSNQLTEERLRGKRRPSLGSGPQPRPPEADVRVGNIIVLSRSWYTLFFLPSDEDIWVIYG